MTDNIDNLVPISTAKVTNPASSVPTISSFDLDFSSVLKDITLVIETKITSTVDSFKSFLTEDETMSGIFYSVFLFSLIPIGIYLTLLFLFLQYSSIHKIIIIIVFIIVLFRITINLNKLKKKLTGSKMINTEPLRNKVRYISEKVTNLINKILIPITSTVLVLLTIIYAVKIVRYIYKTSRDTGPYLFKEKNIIDVFNESDKLDNFTEMVLQDNSIEGKLNRKFDVLLKVINSKKIEVEGKLNTNFDVLLQEIKNLKNSEVEATVLGVKAE